MKNYFCIIFLISTSISAQTRGVVKDSISGKPISYVNIWVENENIATSSEENGEFSININDRNKKLIFSAIGYNKKTIKVSSANEVRLNPKSIEIEEVVISKRFETKIIEIGKTKSSISQAFDNGPKIETKFFPYFPSYKKTKYIKQVSIVADSKIDATIKIHFLSVDEKGFPGEELLKKDFIVVIKKGVFKNTFDVTKFNLKMPKQGIFVAFEKLIIEKNKLETTTTDYNTNTTKKKTTYYPFILYNHLEKDVLFTFSGGKWNKETQTSSSGIIEKTMVFEPAINLILSN